MRQSGNPLGVATLLLSIAPVSSWACATCGCTVNSDAAMGYSTVSGWRVNLEYTYIDQDELRGGTGTANPEQVVNNPSNPSLGGGEIEKDTINRYITLGLSYRPNADWNFNLLAPYIERDHTTYGEQQQPYTPSESAPDQISGALADTTDTAGTVAYLSPGITAQIMHKLHFYGVVQFPVYSNLDGYQLFAHWTVTAGLSYAF